MHVTNCSISLKYSDVATAIKQLQEIYHEYPEHNLTIYIDTDDCSDDYVEVCRRETDQEVIDRVEKETKKQKERLEREIEEMQRKLSELQRQV